MKLFGLNAVLTWKLNLNGNHNISLKCYVVNYPDFYQSK